MDRYLIEESILHYILWAGSKATLSHITEDIERIREYVPIHHHRHPLAWFVNPPHLQSVPTIAHAHVFLNMNGDGDGDGDGDGIY